MPDDRLVAAQVDSIFESTHELFFPLNPTVNVVTGEQHNALKKQFLEMFPRKLKNFSRQFERLSDGPFFFGEKPYYCDFSAYHHFSLAKILDPEILNRYSRVISFMEAFEKLPKVDDYLDKRPDIILSGINSGCNVGEDVTYSGTIAAAMEGLIRRIPSIAISQNYEAGKKNQISWDSSQFFLKNLLVDLTNQGWSNNVFMNINFPYCSAEKVKSIQVTTQGNRDTDDLIINEVEASKFRFGLRRRLEENAKLNLPPLNEGIKGYMTDVEAIANQHISVTPFHLDLTHHKSLEDLKNGLKTNLN